MSKLSDTWTRFRDPASSVYEIELPFDAPAPTGLSKFMEAYHRARMTEYTDTPAPEAPELK
jgi:hypothetical protein